MARKSKRLIGTRTSLLVSIGLILGAVLAVCIVVMTREIPIVERHLVSSGLYYSLEGRISEGPSADGGPTVFPNPDQKFYTDDPRFPEGAAGIPKRYSKYRPGYSEYEGEERAYFVYVIEKNEHRYAIESDQTEFEEMERTFGITITGIAALLFAIALALTAWRVTAALRPARVAAHEISKSIRDGGGAKLSVKVPDDEIGFLALTCDRACRHVYKLLEKERFFSSDLSHELRTHLAVITSSCELLEETDLTELQRSKVRSIESACQMILTLTRVLLSLARDGGRGSSDDEQVTLGEAAAKVVAAEQDGAGERGLSLKVEGAGGEGRYPLSLIFTVMDNLVSNAVRNTKQGGVTVVLEPGRFKVEDTGVGIARDDLPKIFECFYRGRASTGHGVGLSLVKRICDDRGWDIKVDSELGRGTTFAIGLGGSNA
jgi:signal transduction histidine kinase